MTTRHTSRVSHLTSHLTLLAGAVAVLLSRCATQALIFSNASFETVPSLDGSQLDQGYLPSQWTSAADIVPGADSFGEDGLYGLLPSGASHFTGRTARDGQRWVAGADFIFAKEAIAQPGTLVPNQAYTWSASLLRSQIYTSPGGWNLALASTADVLDPNLTVVASLAGTSDSDNWVDRSVTFNAPANVLSFSYLVLVPRSDDSGVPTYVAIDHMALTAVPEPGETTLACGVLLGGMMVVRRLRRV